MGMGNIVDAHADAAGGIAGFVELAGDHLRMLAFGPDRGAVLAVAGEVEGAAQFLLQRDRLADHLFVTGDVFAGRDHRQCAPGRVQGVAGMDGGREGSGHGGRSATKGSAGN
jgi:hypothetical protein